MFFSLSCLLSLCYLSPSEQDIIINFDSLPPLGVDGPTAQQERVLARSVYECAVQVAVREGDTDGFQRYVASLRPYYSGYGYNFMFVMHC